MSYFNPPLNERLPRLLILACSQTKNPEPWRCTKATEYYDGPAYRMLRKSSQTPPGPSATAVLSAEVGLIRSCVVPQPYDRKMDATRATELAAPERIEVARQTLRTLKVGDACVPASFEWAEVFFFGGCLYREVIQAYESAGLFGARPVTYARGQIGKQLHQLKSFLVRCHHSTPAERLTEEVAV